MSQVSYDFEKYGGSYLLSEDNYYRHVSGYSEIGRPDGQFIAPSNQMDELLNNYPNDPREWEKQLGLEDGSLGNDNIHRVDVYNPQEYEPRLPTSDLSGANDKFLDGGKTPGGQDECVINPFPNPENNPNVGKIYEIPSGQSKAKDYGSEQTKDIFRPDKVSDGGGARAPNGVSVNSESMPSERGSKPTEPVNNPQRIPAATRGDKPHEATQTNSSAQLSQRGTPPGSIGGEDSKAPTSSSSNPNDKISASNNSAKAADDASKVASEQPAQNVAPKPNGMGM